MKRNLRKDLLQLIETQKILNHIKNMMEQNKNLNETNPLYYLPAVWNLVLDFRTDLIKNITNNSDMQYAGLLTEFKSYID